MEYSEFLIYEKKHKLELLNKRNLLTVLSCILMILRFFREIKVDSLGFGILLIRNKEFLFLVIIKLELDQYLSVKMERILPLLIIEVLFSHFIWRRGSI